MNVRIGVFSDAHLGFGEKTEREKEAILQAKAAMQLLLKQKVDLILFAGDFFDERIPSIEALRECLELLLMATPKESQAKKIVVEKNNEKKEHLFSGIPFIAISGTHEYRAKDYTNVLELFEKAGLLCYLHCSKAIIENNGERVCVFGLSGVPEQYSSSVLKQWNPLPEKDSFNILMLHQSFKELLPMSRESEKLLSMEQLPHGFQLIINGHFHWRTRKKLGNSLFIIPGSTIITQMKKIESKKKKSVFVFDTSAKKLSFFELPNQRELFHEKIVLKESSAKQAIEMVKNKIREILSQSSNESKPMIRIRVFGKLGFGESAENFSTSEIEKEFRQKAILSIEKAFETKEFRKSVEELKELHSQNKSIIEIGLELLEENLSKSSFEKSFDARKAFELFLTEKNHEKILAELLKETENPTQ